MSTSLAGCPRGPRSCRPDETAATAGGVLRRAASWFAERGITVERVLSANGSPHISDPGRGTCTGLAVERRRDRPHAARGNTPPITRLTTMPGRCS